MPAPITVQRICRTAKDEKEVRQMLDQTWKNPTISEAVLTEAITRNRDLYQFEKSLEEDSGQQPSTEIESAKVVQVP